LEALSRGPEAPGNTHTHMPQAKQSRQQSRASREKGPEPPTHTFGFLSSSRWHTESHVCFVGRHCPAALETQGSSYLIPATHFSPVCQLRRFGPGPPSHQSPTLPAPQQLRAALASGSIGTWQGPAKAGASSSGRHRSWTVGFAPTSGSNAQPRAWCLPLAAPPSASCLPRGALPGKEAWRRWPRTYGSHSQECNPRCLQLVRSTSKSGPCSLATPHGWQYAPCSMLTHGPGHWPWLG